MLAGMLSSQLSHKAPCHVLQKPSGAQHQHLLPKHKIYLRFPSALLLLCCSPCPLPAPGPLQSPRGCAQGARTGLTAGLVPVIARARPWGSSGAHHLRDPQVYLRAPPSSTSGVPNTSYPSFPSEPSPLPQQPPRYLRASPLHLSPLLPPQSPPHYLRDPPHTSGPPPHPLRPPPPHRPASHEDVVGPEHGQRQQLVDGGPGVPAEVAKDEAAAQRPLPLALVVLPPLLQHRLGHLLRYRRRRHRTGGLGRPIAGHGRGPEALRDTGRARAPRAARAGPGCGAPGGSRYGPGAAPAPRSPPSPPARCGPGPAPPPPPRRLRPRSRRAGAPRLPPRHVATRHGLARSRETPPPAPVPARNGAARRLTQGAQRPRRERGGTQSARRTTQSAQAPRRRASGGSARHKMAARRRDGAGRSRTALKTRSSSLYWR